MGLVILPVALFLAMAWVGATLGLAALCWRTVRQRAGRPIAALATATVCVSSCVLPNTRGVSDQRQFEKIKADCGWQVFHPASEVEGVFVRSEEPHTYTDMFTAEFASRLAQVYGVVQYLGPDGVVQFTRGAGGVIERSAVPARTLRYEVVFSSVLIGNYRREQALVMDQPRDVLARNVEYWPVTPSNDRTLIDYALKVITVSGGRSVCQVLSPSPDLADRVKQVLVPRRSM